MKKKITHIIGIDEAGRGPLAGPVAVGLALVPRGFDWRRIPHVGDSKKVSERRRKEIFKLTKKLKSDGVLDYFVSLVSAKTIDRIGITKAVQMGIQKCLSSISMNPQIVELKLDGLLSAPKEYVYQETIIKGDAKEKVIGLASIMAKVTRDSYMCRESKKYPKYGFEIHKGYGTLLHRTNIRENGLCAIHRKSFTRNVLKNAKNALK